MKITWLGDTTDPTGGPRINIWNGIRFPIGEAVEVTDAHMIAKAKVHPQYKIESEHVEKAQGEERQEGKKEEGKAVDNREKSTGYVPVKKKVRKKKPQKSGDGEPAPAATDANA